MDIKNLNKFKKNFLIYLNLDVPINKKKKRNEIIKNNNNNH